MALPTGALERRGGRRGYGNRRELHPGGIAVEREICCGLRRRVFATQRLDAVEQSGHARHSVLLALVLGGHVALIATLGEDLPHPVEIDGTVTVAEAVADMSVSSVRNASLDLTVLVFIGVSEEVRDVEVHPCVRRAHAVQNFERGGGFWGDPAVVLDAKRDTLLARVIASGSHHFNRPVDALFDCAARRKLTGEDAKVRGT